MMAEEAVAEWAAVAAGLDAVVAGLDAVTGLGALAAGAAGLAGVWALAAVLAASNRIKTACFMGLFISCGFFNGSVSGAPPG